MSAPKCGFIKGNERIVKLLDIVKPEIMALKETCITVSWSKLTHKFAAFFPDVPYSSDSFILLFLQVSSWISHLIPKIEDGNDFGVAIQVINP